MHTVLYLIWAQVIDSFSFCIFDDNLTPCVLRGHGHTINYLDRTRVTTYIAVEPNTNMHARIRKAAARAGFDEGAGSLRVLSCGAEDTDAILAAAGGGVDTIIAVLVLCSVPEPQGTLRTLVRDVLVPGGTLLFYEHVRSDLSSVASFQDFLAPLWSAVADGCRMDRPTHKWIEALGEEGMWREGHVLNEQSESDGRLFTNRWGRFIKA